MNNKKSFIGVNQTSAGEDINDLNRNSKWLEITGAKFLMEDYPNYYQSLKLRNINFESKSTKQIDKDVNRTYPTIKEFSRLELREILIAYSIRNPNVGYCQGLNFIAANLLLLNFSEEESFWIYTQIIEKYLPYDYFTSMAGIMLDQKIFDTIFRLKIPEVSKHLDRLGLESCLLTVQWFICLYAFNFNLEIVKRLWDLIFINGHNYLHQIGLATFWVLRKEIIQSKDFVSVLRIFDETCQKINDFEVLLTALNKRNFRIKPGVFSKISSILQNEVRNEFIERFNKKSSTFAALASLDQNCVDDDDCKHKVYLTGDFFTLAKNDMNVNVVDGFIETRECIKHFSAESLKDIDRLGLVGKKNHTCSRDVRASDEDEEEEGIEFITRSAAQSVRKSFAVITSFMDEDI